MKKLVIIVLLLISGVVSAQSVTGTSGLIHIPSARMLEDGQLVIGAAFIPKGIYHRTYGPNKFDVRLNPGLNTYITYGFLPFLEIMFRYSHELNIPVSFETEYFPDRMFSARLRVINETKNLPSIVFGIHDLAQYIGVVSGVPNFSTNYVVGSKLFSISDKLNIDLDIGYAFDISKFKTVAYNGLFGGVEIYHNSFGQFSLNAEYDSNKFIFGGKINLFSKINLMLGLWDLNKPTFAFNYLF